MKLPHHIAATLEKELTAARKEGLMEGLMFARVLVLQIRTGKVNGRPMSKAAACDMAQRRIEREEEGAK